MRALNKNMSVKVAEENGHKIVVGNHPSHQANPPGPNDWPDDALEYKLTADTTVWCQNCGEITAYPTDFGLTFHTLSFICPA